MLWAILISAYQNPPATEREELAGLRDRWNGWPPSHLAPTTRSKVAALLAKHPDYAAWTKGWALEARSRAAILPASVWPDTTRNDPRFHEDNRTPAPNIPGLPAGAQAR